MSTQHYLTRLGVALLAILVAPVGITVASADARTGTRAVALKQTKYVTYQGASYSEPAGDVNGDDVPDFLLIAARLGTPNGTFGRVFVVFGALDMHDTNLNDRDLDGFMIDGVRSLWPAASGAGDVNGDGLDDVIVGAPDAHRAYVVFGKTSTTPVHLLAFDANAQGLQGYRIDGRGRLGEGVSAAGDVNRDGLADVAVGAPFEGATYVLFGKTDFLPVDTASVHQQRPDGPGYLISTPEPEYNDYWVAGGTDINGDQIGDIIVTIFDLNAKRRGIWVVYGKRTTGALDVSRLGTAGFRIRGGRSNGQLAGDVNGDGYHDVVFVGTGALGVAFGSRSARDVDLKTLDQGTGLKIVSPDGGGHDLSGADVNGDGLSDLIIGAEGAQFGGESSGSTYVAFGRRRSSEVNLWSLGARGFRIDGRQRDGDFGGSVSSPGDLDGDGRAEIIVGAYQNHQSAYLIWGRSLPR